MTSPCPGKNLRRFGLCRHERPSEIEPSSRKFHALEREITKIEGESKFSSFFALEFFFYDEHTPCKSPCSNLAFFRAHLPYLGDYVRFLGINADNSSSNNRCMKGCTTTAWKTMLVPFSIFSCLLQGMGRYFDEMCGNSQPQTFVYSVFHYRKMK